MQLRIKFAIFLLFLSGCASQIYDNASITENWQQKLVTQQPWQLTGKLAIITSESRQSVNFLWQTNDGVDSLNLSSFVGTSVLALTKTNQLTTIKLDGQIHQGENAQQLVNRLTGINLPFLNDPNWLKGLPNTSNYESDALNRVNQATLIDNFGNQWQLRYQNYQKHGGYWLPYSISLSHQNIRLKLKVYTWQI